MANESNKNRQRMRQIRDVSDVIRQMNRIFREARFGDLDTQDMARYGNYLNLMCNMIKVSDLEERIEALENNIKSQNSGLRVV